MLPVTYLLRAMWHIRPQHNSANQLYQPLRFVPHSSSFIQLFPFLSLLSSPVLSLLYPVFAAVLGPQSESLGSLVVCSALEHPLGFGLRAQGRHTLPT